MDDFDEGKRQFLDLVKEIDPQIDVVIPTSPSNGLFLISLTKGANRKFLTIPEDDLLDLGNEDDVRQRTIALLKDTIEALG